LKSIVKNTQINHVARLSTLSATALTLAACHSDGEEGNAPLFDIPDTYSVATRGNGATISSGVLGLDDGLSILLISDPENGTAAQNQDGSIDYTLNAGYTGNDSVQVEISNAGGLSEIVTIQLDVGNPANGDTDPLAADDKAVLAEDGQVSVAAKYGVLSNDFDKDDLTASLLAGPSHGMVTLNADGSYIYTPNPDYNGQDTFTYTVTDEDGDTATGAVNLLITPENDAPVAPDFFISGDRETKITGQLPATDVDGDTLTYTILQAPNNGIVNVYAGGTFEYTGEKFFWGTDTFTYTVDDGNGGVVTATATVEVLPNIPLFGAQFNGVSNGDLSGRQVSHLGDVNGDGRDDFIIGAMNGDPNGGNSGESFVVFGQSGFIPSVDLASLSGSNGFVINGIGNGDRAGEFVSAAGDINNDGYDDILVSAWRADPNGNNSGEAYIVFGGPTFAASLELSALNGTNGLRIDGITNGDNSGFSVSGGGDVNGDGFNDIVIGARNGDPGISNAGETFVVFGRDTGFNPVFALSNLNGTNGFTINGFNSGDRAGEEVYLAGDFNGDGRDDIIIGAWRDDPNGANSGEAYVVFGFDQSTIDTVDLSALTGTDGFAIQGNAANDRLGFNVTSAGDVNGDGLDDILIGAHHQVNGRPGEAFLILGTEDPITSPLDPSTLDGTNGFIFTGLSNGDRVGWGMSRAGDVNGDGYDDFLLGAQRGDTGGSNRGETYLIYGGRCQLELYDLVDGQQDGLIDLSLLATPPVL
jgi:VCBS repeat-containing protein